MDYKEVSTTSFGEKLKSSLIGIVLGPILILVSVYFLWNNEFRSVERKSALLEWQKIVKNINVNEINPTNNSAYIYWNWEIQWSWITEPDFHFPIDGVIVKRNVEMYQWIENAQTETKDNLWGSTTETTTYTYKKEWSSTPIDSNNFNQPETYKNPTEWKYTSWRNVSENIQLGQLKFSQNMIDLLPTPKLLTFTEDLKNTILSGSTLWSWSIQNNVIFIWNNISTPEIWDLKISYTFLPNKSQISVLWQQNENFLLSNYLLKNNQDISRIEIWNVSSTQMFKNMQDENTILTWILRGAFIMIMFIGFSIFLSILPTLASVIPFLWSLIGIWTWLISLIGTLILGWSTIALAWFAARPLISIGIFIVIIGIIIAIKKWNFIKKS